ncbi:ABC transporter transmembrane domain-containing protein [Trichocoleus desertorum AS-A10]|uniref:ABC transporter transmembrane domain-containing protein n=1 Tax=Trichocoleus desertorum TaxID=1481672 RepID=UPI00329828A7
MNQSLKTQAQSQHSPESSKALAASQLLSLIQADLSLSADLSQAFQIKQFHLGEDCVSSELVNSAQNSACHEQLYLVCAGRVRLLSFDPTQQREAPVMVLEAGETWGADSLCAQTPLPYRAIAASTVEAAILDGAALTEWFDQLPRLRDYLLRQAQQRDRLIFLKTLTNLRSLPSQKLRQVSDYLVETQVAAGNALSPPILAETDYCWLRNGEIQSQEAQSQPLMVGASWHCSKAPLTDWMAQTNLIIYRLSLEHSLNLQVLVPEIGDLIKHLAESEVVANNGHLQAAPAQPPAPATVIRRSRKPQEHLARPAADGKTAQASATSEPINFPAPSRRYSRRHLWAGYPFIQQQSSSDCGVACLAMVGRYWGQDLSLNFLRNLAGVDRSGVSLKTLAVSAERLGFHARPVRASLSALVDQTQPWIAHWQGDHYVVVYRTQGRKILIADPAAGKRSLSHQEFQQYWTGYALLLEPTEKLNEIETKKPSLDRFLRLLWPYRGVLLQIILASLLIQIFGLITPLFTQIILDQVVTQKSLLTLNVFAIGILIFGIWSITLTTIRQYLLDYFSNRLDLTLISSFVSHALLLPLKFFESRHVGDVLTRVQENQKIQMFLTRQAVTAWLDALMIFVYLGLMFYYNWQLTLLVVAIIPPIVILVLVATPLLRQISREIFNREAAENSTLVEILTGIATVKAAAAERDLRWGWEERLTSMLNARFQGQKLSNTLQAVSGLINTIGSTALLWYGASLVIRDQLTIGQFVAFNMLIGNVINPVLRLVGLWDEFQEVIVSVERLDDVFSTEPEESVRKPLLALPRLRGDVQFDNVTFRYQEDEEHNTLQNISFQVQAGQTIAIVGRSGSGKTTLMNLLQGLYHPTNGRIWMDGHDIRHVSPQSLRSQLGVVPQECFLFSGTILENITLSRPNFALEEVVEVAKLAEAHTFIQAMPLGYNTKVGERGAMLSGGQRQRIAIARSLLGNPRILILDEATSSLDTESERRFQQNLARISRDRTTFIIAHRLSTVRHADCILVIDRGVLLEQGTHEELIALHGLYYHLAQQQLDL